MGRNLLFCILGPALALCAVILAGPSQADISEKDRQFLTSLKSIRWEIYDPTVLISQGHMVCNEGLAHGVSWREMRGQLMNWGYSLFDASLLIANANFAYCPEYDEIDDEIMADDAFRHSRP